MQNIRPCWSARHLWWGHRIPAWYCDRCDTVHVSRTDLAACPSCGGAVRQDPDVLDTWVSSGLWPFSTMGWPDDTPELRAYYPTSVLVTGFDILFFWVARMAMLGLHFTQAVPFHDVYIHALVRDAEGQKMSKSKGNVADPLEVMDKYGTDAFRFTLAALVGLGRDVRVSDERIEGYRNFANKLWNAARLVLSNLDGYDAAKARKVEPVLADRWIQSRLAATVGSVRAALRRYRFNDAASAVYQFVWHEYCDWDLEIAKLSLYRAEDPPERLRTQHTLVEVPEATLPRVRLRIDPRASRPRNSELAVVAGSEIYVELAGVIDPAAERARRQKEIGRLTESVEFRRAKLARPEFVERAPAEIVARERERLAAEEALLEKLTASLGWIDDR